MKKVTLLIILLPLLGIWAQPTQAQGDSLDFQFAVRIPAPNGITMTIDPEGNIYAPWEISGQVQLGDDTLNTLGYLDSQSACLTKYNKDGSYAWTKVIGGAANLVTLTINSDSQGNIYWGVNVHASSYPLNTLKLVGDTLLHFDTDTSIYWPLRPHNPLDRVSRLMLLKYNANGEFQWLSILNDADTGFIPPTPITTNGIYIDTAGFITLPIHTPPTSFGDSSFFATHFYHNVYGDFSGSDHYLLKLNPNGQVIGLDHLEYAYRNNGPEWMNGKMFDPVTKHFYIVGSPSVGSTPDAVQVFGEGADSVVITNAAAVACFDSSGHFLWVKGESPSTFKAERVGSIDFDPFGNSYFSTVTNYLTQWDNHEIFNKAVTGADNPNIYPYVVKFDSTGTVLWTANGSSPHSPANFVRARYKISYSNGLVGVGYALSDTFYWDEGLMIAPESCCPPSDRPGFVSRLNAETGACVSMHKLHSTQGSWAAPEAIYSDISGNFYAAGHFTGGLTTVNNTIYNESGYPLPVTDMFIAKLTYPNSNNCTPPQAHFSTSPLNQTEVTFTYDGDTPVDSIMWQFGDGVSLNTSGNDLNITHNFPSAGQYFVSAIAYNTCGSNMYYQTLNIGQVGIGEIPGFSEIKVFPNPTEGQLFISGVQIGMQVSVIDGLGRLLLQKQITATTDKLDVHSLASGSYILLFTDKNGKQGSTKFVKE